MVLAEVIITAGGPAEMASISALVVVSYTVDPAELDEEKAIEVMLRSSDCARVVVVAASSVRSSVVGDIMIMKGRGRKPNGLSREQERRLDVPGKTVSEMSKNLKGDDDQIGINELDDNEGFHRTGRAYTYSQELTVLSGWAFGVSVKPGRPDSR